MACKTARNLAAHLALIGLLMAGPCLSESRATAAKGLEGTSSAFAIYVSDLDAPIGLTHAGDGSGRLFIIQQSGAVRAVVNDLLRAIPLLTLRNSAPITQCRPSPASPLVDVGFTSGGERGLLGLAFHPNFASNGQVFVSFSDSNGDSFLARFTMADPQANVMTAGDLASCLTILRVDQDFSNHNGGGIGFGPDGYLYFGLGDGGSGGDPCNRGQTINPALLDSAASCAVDASFTGSGGNADSRALLGSMLRLDVDASTPAASNGLCASAADGSANYAIPADNPFRGADPASACDEIWAWGLRNPWRWSFDRATGDLFIGDVGQNTQEEISFEPAASGGGLNFGWKLCEGTVNHAGSGCGTPELTAPIITYSRANGRCAVTGGYRYRGPVRNARGIYFFADYCAGNVWISTFNGSAWAQPVTGPVFQSLGFGITSFGEDEAGNLFAVQGTQIWRFVLLPIADQVSLEGDAAALDVAGNFADPESDALLFGVTGLPPGLSISPAGLINGSIGFGSAGSYSVTVTADDGFSSTSGSFAWRVAQRSDGIFANGFESPVR